MARTNVDIDEAECAKVMRPYRLSTRREAINLAPWTLAADPSRRRWPDAQLQRARVQPLLSDAALRPFWWAAIGGLGTVPKPEIGDHVP